MYTQYTLNNDPSINEILVALLAGAGFDSFQETDAGLLAFGEAKRKAYWTDTLDEYADRFGFTYHAEALPDKNWNHAWESQFQPLAIGDRLYLRADFHEPDPTYPLELVITPKMAFGTGHHATTHMMCELMFDLRWEGKRVLDYGSGTGVLAILAAKLGAGEVDAVDIEQPAVENTLENAQHNGTRLARVVLGQLQDVPEGRPYDVILANINRNVLLATCEALYGRLARGGTVLFSGILAKDETLLRKSLTAAGFEHRVTRRREDWRALVFGKS